MSTSPAPQKDWQEVCAVCLCWAVTAPQALGSIASGKSCKMAAFSRHFVHLIAFSVYVKKGSGGQTVPSLPSEQPPALSGAVPGTQGGSWP